MVQIYQRSQAHLSMATRVLGRQLSTTRLQQPTHFPLRQVYVPQTQIPQ